MFDGMYYCEMYDCTLALRPEYAINYICLSPFPTVFSKTLFTMVVKTGDCVEKELTGTVLCEKVA